jgi:hypothetical protein
VVEAQLAVVDLQRVTYTTMIAPFDTTVQCKAVAHGLDRELDRIKEEQRELLAENLGRSLHEPLQEICKVRAKCLRQQG